MCLQARIPWDSCMLKTTVQDRGFADRRPDASDFADTLLPSDNDALAVVVENSTDLAALAAALTKAESGGNILVANSQFNSGGGTVKINAGGIAARTVRLRDVQVSAGVIRANAFNAGGRDGLVIDGGNYRAAESIHLLSGGDFRPAGTASGG